MTLANDVRKNLIVVLSSDTNQFFRDIEKTNKAIEKQFGAMKRVGESLTRSITVPIAGITAALVAGAYKLGEYADGILDLEQATGLTTKTLQELRYVAQVTGDEFEGYTNAIGQLQKKFLGIEQDGGMAAKMMKQLGIDIDDANGNIRPMDTILFDVIEKLQQIPNVSERNVVATQLFGKAFADVAPLLGMTSEELMRLRQEANKTGAVLSPEALKAADQFRQKVAELKTDAEGLWRTLSAEVIPVLQDDLIPLLQDKGVPTVHRFIEGWKNLSPQMKTAAGWMIGVTAAAGPTLSMLSDLLKVMAKLSVLKIPGWLGVAGIAAGATIAAMTADPIAAAQSRVNQLQKEIADMQAKDGIASDELTRRYEELAEARRVLNQLTDVSTESVNEERVAYHQFSGALDVVNKQTGRTIDFSKELKAAKESEHEAWEKTYKSIIAANDAYLKWQMTAFGSKGIQDFGGTVYTNPAIDAAMAKITPTYGGSGGVPASNQPIQVNVNVDGRQVAQAVVNAVGLRKGGS